VEWDYDYDGALMTRITDEKGHVLLRNSYDGRVLTRQQFGNGATYSYDYHSAPNGYYADKVVVTLPDRAKWDFSVAGAVPDYIRNHQ
jgi:hypothetical protein